MHHILGLPPAHWSVIRLLLVWVHILILRHLYSDMYDARYIQLLSWSWFTSRKCFVSVEIFSSISQSQSKLALSVSSSQMRKPFVCSSPLKVFPSQPLQIMDFPTLEWELTSPLRGVIFSPHKNILETENRVCICLFDERQLCKAGVILERELAPKLLPPATNCLQFHQFLSNR